MLVKETTKWEDFRKDLENDIYSRIALKTKHQLEDQLENFIKSIQKLHGIPLEALNKSQKMIIYR